MPEAPEKEEGGGRVGDFEEDLRKFCGQGLLNERFIGHPETFFQGTMSTFSRGREMIGGKRTVEYTLP